MKRPSNPLALAVLTLLAEAPMHPYEMSTTLKQRRKEDSIRLNFGSLYSVVASLHKRELIEVRETLREGNRPERTVYAITDAGRELMTAWLRELLAVPAKEYPAFEAALSLMPTLPVDEVVRGLEERLSRLRADQRESTDMLERTAQAGMPRLFRIEHEYELALLAAEVEFVTALLEDLRAGRVSGLRIWRRLHELRAGPLSPEHVEAAVHEEFAEDFAWVDRLSGTPRTS